MNKELSKTLALERQKMSRTGVLDLSNLNCDSLIQLGSQKTLVELNISNSSITSLHTLPPQPSMKSIIADNSKIDTLAGLGNQPRLAKISMIGTPVSRNENFRLSAIIAIGTRLSSINGTPVTKSERNMAACYPPIAKALVGCGWVAQYPPPSEQDFRYLAYHMDINAKETDFVIPAVAAVEPAPAKKQDEFDDAELTFEEKLAGILRPLGFPIRCGPDMGDDIVKSIDRICSVLTMIDEAGSTTNE